MTKIWITLVLIPLTFLSCQNSEDINSRDTIELNTYTFADFVEVNDIESAEMSNNSGTFNLSESQLEHFIEELCKMTYDPNMNAKVGIIYAVLKMRGKEYMISTATHGSYAEIHVEMITKNKDLIESQWLYFKTNGINFDNYKEEVKTVHDLK